MSDFTEHNNVLKLTKEKIEELCGETHYFNVDTLTICVINLTNGGQVIGTSNTISPETWVEEVGRKVARDNAIGRVWELEGYAMKTRDAALLV